jgi:hypothetical protein
MSDLIQLGLDSPICLHTYSTVIQIPTESNTPTDLTAPELFDPFGETDKRILLLLSAFANLR